MAGKDSYGWQVCEVPAAELTAEEKITLVESADYHQLSQRPPADYYIPDYVVEPGRGQVTVDDGSGEATIAAVKARLAIIAENMRKTELEKKAKHQEEIERAKKKVDENIKYILAVSEKCWRIDGFSDNKRARRSPIFSEGEYLEESKNYLHARLNEPNVVAAIKQIDEKIAAINADLIEQHAKETALYLENKRKEALLPQQTAETVDWLVAQNGTESQQKRHTAGVLPKTEVLEILRHIIFGSIDHLPKYKRINDADLGNDCRGEVSYETTELTELTEGEFATTEKIKQLFSNEIRIGGRLVILEITPQKHTAECSVEETEVTKKSVKITAGIEGTSLNISRLLDLDEMVK